MLAARKTVLALALALAATPACSGGGSGTRRVEAVLDGDTITLDGGERVRLLGIDAPERTSTVCWGDEAFNFLFGHVGGREVRIEHDVIREDRNDRTLAWVHLDGELVNATLLEEGHACLLICPPNGEDRAPYLQALQDAARFAGRGLWASCGGCIPDPEGC